MRERVLLTSLVEECKCPRPQGCLAHLQYSKDREALRVKKGSMDELSLPVPGMERSDGCP